MKNLVNMFKQDRKVENTYLTNFAKLNAFVRIVSDEPLTGYYYNDDYGYYEEGDELFRKRILESKKKATHASKPTKINAKLIKP